MTSPLENLRDYLNSRGMRLTPERETTARLIFSLTPPFTAESVVQAVLQLGQSVSRATIYRMLHILAEAGQITVESESDRETQYSHQYKPLQRSDGISSLCQSTHAKMIAGTCPWCGRAILNGFPEDESN